MAAGRPTKYKPEYCQAIKDFFNIEPTQIIDGKTVAIDLPFIQSFSRTIGVSKSTLYKWAEEHEEFSDALKFCKENQERILAANALSGRYNATFAIFTAKNILEWRDRQEITGADGAPLTASVEVIFAGSQGQNKGGVP